MAQLNSKGQFKNSIIIRLQHKARRLILLGLQKETNWEVKAFGKK